MGAALCKLAHVELVTPDIERSLWFFCDLLGLHEVERDGQRIYLRCFGELDHHSLTLREGPSGVDHVAFRTAQAEHVEAFAKALALDGIAVQSVSAGDERGQGDAIRFIAPHLEVPFELFFAIERSRADDAHKSKLPSNSARFRPCAPRRIDHINFSTALEEIGRSDEWLASRLGFHRRECVRINGQLVGTWMSVTPQVHDVAVTVDREGRRSRLNHIAFTMEEFADTTRLADLLAEHDIAVDVAPGRHGITQGHFYYVRDPGSNHRVELFSGGYLIFDPDWEPIEWDEASFSAYGLKFFGPPWTRENNPTATNTPCFAVPSPLAVAREADSTGTGPRAGQRDPVA